MSLEIKLISPENGGEKHYEHNYTKSNRKCIYNWKWGKVISLIVSRNKSKLDISEINESFKFNITQEEVLKKEGKFLSHIGEITLYSVSVKNVDFIVLQDLNSNPIFICCLNSKIGFGRVANKIEDYLQEKEFENNLDLEIEKDAEDTFKQQKTKEVKEDFSELYQDIKSFTEKIISFIPVFFILSSFLYITS